MPLYEYSCKSCDHAFTKMNMIVDRKLPESEPCPECSVLGKVVQQISTPMIAYSNPGSLKTTDSFNDRLKDIKKAVPKRFQDKLNANIR